jgi:hypothetical protein
MTNRKTTEIVAEIVELLTPLESIERQRAVQASLTLLGETFSAPAASSGAGRGESGSDETSTLPTRAGIWMKQYGISIDELQQVLQLGSGTADVIAGDIPGKNKKEKTYNAYVLTGLASLLSSGNTTFDDKSARELCERFGCYDQANHSSTIKDRGNEFNGTKDTGWNLTAPGLKRGAALVKEMTKN